MYEVFADPAPCRVFALGARKGRGLGKGDAAGVNTKVALMFAPWNFRRRSRAHGKVTVRTHGGIFRVGHAHGRQGYGKVSNAVRAREFSEAVTRGGAVSMLVSKESGIFWMVTSAWLPGRLPTKAHFSGEHLTACLTAKEHFSAGVSKGRYAAWYERKATCEPVKTLHFGRYTLGWYASWYARNRGCWRRLALAG